MKDLSQNAKLVLNGIVLPKAAHLGSYTSKEHDFPGVP